jgi:hypothetical protein
MADYGQPSPGERVQVRTQSVGGGPCGLPRPAQELAWRARVATAPAWGLLESVPRRPVQAQGPYPSLAGRDERYRPAPQWPRPLGGRCRVAGAPTRESGAVRRDCASHRGALLLALGDAGRFLGALSLCLGLLAVTGLALSVAAWVLTSRDLRRMRARVMDPGGLAETARARARARAGVVLSLYGAALWGWLLVLIT